MKASDVLDAIQEYWGKGGRWLFLRELRTGTGYVSLQAIDGFLMDAYPSSGMYRTAYEVKISRSDFLRELKKPQKRREAMRYSNYFYFAAPKGIIRPEEIPVDCGLVEVAPHLPDANRYGDKRKWSVEFTVHASHRDVPGPTWTFLAAALRCQMKGRVAEIGVREETPSAADTLLEATA